MPTVQDTWALHALDILEPILHKIKGKDRKAWQRSANVLRNKARKGPLSNGERASIRKIASTLNVCLNTPTQKAA